MLWMDTRSEGISVNKQLKDAWMLVKTDLLRFKWGALFTLLFSGYMGAISTLMLNGLLKSDQEGDTLVLRAVLILSTSSPCRIWASFSLGGTRAICRRILIRNG